MNTLQKFLTIAFLAASIVIFGLKVDPVGAQEPDGDKQIVVELSDEERAWIRAHPVMVRILRILLTY